MCFGGHTTKMKTSKPKRQTTDNQSEVVLLTSNNIIHVFTFFTTNIIHIFTFFTT